MRGIQGHKKTKNKGKLGLREEARYEGQKERKKTKKQKTTTELHLQ